MRKKKRAEIYSFPVPEVLVFNAMVYFEGDLRCLLHQELQDGWGEEKRACEEIYRCAPLMNFKYFLFYLVVGNKDIN